VGPARLANEPIARPWCERHSGGAALHLAFDLVRLLTERGAGAPRQPGDRAPPLYPRRLLDFGCCAGPQSPKSNCLIFEVDLI